MTTVRLLKNGKEAFPAMFKAIERAGSCIALEMYLVADDETGREFRSHLKKAAQTGIEVMVLVDAWGSLSLPDGFWDTLREAGGTVRWFRPIGKGLLPFRNHRKMLLVDDQIAFIGGLNVANEYYRGSVGEPPWRDNVLEITGIDAVRLRQSFSRMWVKADIPLRKSIFLRSRDRRSRSVRDGKVQFLESGPEHPFHSMRRAYRELIWGATKNIDLAMSYFYPPGSVMRALRRAVNRGVRVRLLFPQKNDVAIARWAAHGLYGRLLRAGMEVWEYKPTMMHAKLTIADDTVIAGSANLDIRSGRLNYELVAIVNDPQVAAGAREDFEADLREAEYIHLDEWNVRPFMQKIKERISYWLLARTDLFISRMEIMRKMW
jgi:cardiolipin synthase A/B